LHSETGTFISPSFRDLFACTGVTRNRAEEASLHLKIRRLEWHCAFKEGDRVEEALK
jgi:hypothetical protein